LLSISRKYAAELDSNEANKHLKSVQSIFVKSNVWKDQWSAISEEISSGNYADLIKSYGENYSFRFGGENLESDLLDGLLEDFSRLNSNVKQSNLEPVIKLFIVKHIEEICSAINQYEIFGIEPLVSSLEKSLAGLYFNPYVKTKLNQDSLLQDIAAYLVVASRRVYQAAAPIAFLLGFMADVNSLAPSIEDLRAEVLHMKAESIDFEKTQKLLSSSANLPTLPHGEEQ